MLKQKVVSWISQNLFDNVSYTVRNGLNKGLRRRGGLGWLPVESNNSPEHTFWSSLDLTDKVVYDIGAFHGLLTIFFARQARKVVAWEPNSINRQRLEQNIRLNSFSNVIVRPYGLAASASRAQMSFDALAPGTASIDKAMAAGSQGEIVELRTLDDETGLEDPDLIKVDVEGYELEVLKGAARTLQRKPDLFLEMHGVNPEDKRRRVEAIVTHLRTIGYSDIVHVESGTQITPENTAIAARGHLHVRVLPNGNHR